jgi:hypothetical protein
VVHEVISRRNVDIDETHILLERSNVHLQNNKLPNHAWPMNHHAIQFNTSINWRGRGYRVINIIINFIYPLHWRSQDWTCVPRVEACDCNFVER